LLGRGRGTQTHMHTDTQKTLTCFIISVAKLKDNRFICLPGPEQKSIRYTPEHEYLADAHWKPELSGRNEKQPNKINRKEKNLFYNGLVFVFLL